MWVYLKGVSTKSHTLLSKKDLYEGFTWVSQVLNGVMTYKGPSCQGDFT